MLKPDGLAPTIELWRKAVPGRSTVSPVLAAMTSVTGAVTRFLHIWPYKSFDERARLRDKAVADGVWPPPGGPSHLASQQVDIYLPAAFSPMKGPSCASVSPTRVMTSSQSPSTVCRNSRAVGYQGLVSPPSVQRQSGAKGMSTQTGRPMAPARLATAVSTVMTRSQSAITAAVSLKSSSSPPTWRTRPSPASFSASPSRSSRWMLMKLTPSLPSPASGGGERENTGARREKGMERLRSLRWLGLPDQA